MGLREPQGVVGSIREPWVAYRPLNPVKSWRRENLRRQALRLLDRTVLLGASTRSPKPTPLKPRKLHRVMEQRLFLSLHQLSLFHFSALHRRNLRILEGGGWCSGPPSPIADLLRWKYKQSTGHPCDLKSQALATHSTNGATSLHASARVRFASFQGGFCFGLCAPACSQCLSISGLNRSKVHIAPFRNSNIKQ